MPARSELAPGRIEAVAEVRGRALRIRDVAGEEHVAFEARDQARGLCDLGPAAHADVAGAEHRDRQSGRAAAATAATATAAAGRRSGGGVRTRRDAQPETIAMAAPRDPFE